MASLLDLSLGQHFTAIFALLFIFVLVFAILQYTKFLEGDKNIHALIAFFAAFLFVLSPKAINAVANFAPWLTVFFMFATFFIVAYTMFGVTTDDITTVIKHPTMAWTLGIVTFVIGAGAIGAAFGQTFLDYSQQGAIPGQVELNEINAAPMNGSVSYIANVQRTIFDPKVIGFIVVIAIAVATVGLIGRKYTGL